MTNDEESFEIVLWGATGFVGELTAEYLAGAYDPDQLDWAIAGRNRDKLEALESELVEATDWDEIPIVTGDAHDPASLAAMADRTDVVCTTVGPYAKFGTNLVAACVQHGTDYCDLTGEVHWMREMIDTFQEDAQLRGSRIVHCCGFDSIPSDLGTLMVQKYAREKYGAVCRRIGTFVIRAAGTFSGGTLDSMANAFEAASRDEEVRRVLAHPYALNPRDEREGPDGSIQMGPRYDDDLGGWTAPFVMASTNEKVVRRSNALLGFRWGRDFSYREAVASGSGVGGAMKAAGVSAATGAFTGAMAVGPVRRFLQSAVLPEPGEGPSREEIEGGSFEMRIVGNGEDAEGEAFEIRGTVAADRDPGYGATAIMLGESAVALARDETETPLDAGMLTPSSGIGMPLVERLRDAGMTFEIEESTT